LLSICCWCYVIMINNERYLQRKIHGSRGNNVGELSKKVREHGTNT
jgi:hypothetical protein